jgi:uncharacterized membrane protein YphA (DoxX/SURF4 family)
MLLAAGFISLFLAPAGLRPRWGVSRPPSRASLLLLRLLWFSIYFESGIAKFLGGDPSWRNLTALDEYYQNGPLPTWIGWYAQQLPQWFHAGTALLTLAVELSLVWAVFLPRRFRITCFFIVTGLQIAMILTANYAFLNYLVLSLGFLLLDDRFIAKFLPALWCRDVRENLLRPPEHAQKEELIKLDLLSASSAIASSEENSESSDPEITADVAWISRWRAVVSTAGLWIAGIALAWLLYANVFQILRQVFRTVPLPAQPVVALEPFRIADTYGLFGRMTWKRYEIEFQGSNDGTTWIAYPFRNKPQNTAEAPRIYAPYQPRFDWNLWFASLDYWRDNEWVVRTEQLLLSNDPDVDALFAANPFSDSPPKQVRAVLWQYWFTDLKTKRATHRWWRREYLGLYAPALMESPDGKIMVTAWPETPPPLP